MRVAGICRNHGFYKGSKCLECIEQESNVFYTSKDKLWEFMDVNTTGKPLEIRTKGQWRRHLKRLNMHDDVPKYHKGEGLKQSDPKLDRDEVKNLIRERFIEKGVYNKLYKKERRF